MLGIKPYLASAIAIKAHKNQFRRDGVTPYISHVEQVVSNIRKRGGSDEERTVAWLHDVIEDTDVTIDYLREQFPQKIVDAVIALTHQKGESYESAILRAKANPIARNVKIADNLANLSDNPTDKQILKYAKSLQTLMS